jgi:predicted dehydrogenase
MTPQQQADRRLGIGLVGAGRFASFIAAAVASSDAVELRAVADPDSPAASRLAGQYDARPTDSAETLLIDERVDIVAIATPPADHSELVEKSIAAGKHVFCEKPIALDSSSAQRLADLVERSDPRLVVDHVLRYNPIIRALTRIQDAGRLLGRVQRFCFENDASDEDLHERHWFWDEATSGGIFIEHGVHFFDAATLLIGRPPTSVQATSARRRDGWVDMVSATLNHGEDTLATHTHSFTHAHRCERQLMRLDYGTAEVRVEGWIPVHAVIDAWTDDTGLMLAKTLPGRSTELLDVPGFRLSPAAGVTARVQPGAACDGGRALGRGEQLDLPDRVVVELTLGGHPAKAEVYAESVRACMSDLVSSIRTGAPTNGNAATAAAAVQVAAAATAAARLGRTLPLSNREASEPKLAVGG